MPFDAPGTPPKIRTGADVAPKQAVLTFRFAVVRRTAATVARASARRKDGLPPLTDRSIPTLVTNFLVDGLGAGSRCTPGSA